MKAAILILVALVLNFSSGSAQVSLSMQLELESVDGDWIQVDISELSEESRDKAKSFVDLLLGSDPEQLKSIASLDVQVNVESSATDMFIDARELVVVEYCTFYRSNPFSEPVIKIYVCADGNAQRMLIVAGTAPRSDLYWIITSVLTEGVPVIPFGYTLVEAEN
ncbi:MAG: hypothetical protein M9934_10805 [Thermomicrobiales bacterium]|nr:hypothetical protein [Thermomicrobiales bacterium]MCO5219121.1 hypothetical protein [Thermomicrobiales bacterium]MCO5228755.1 hypothetical protein [Thermomicrobiales bacterium]